MSEVDVLFDENGEPKFRILDNKRIVNFDGESIAWIDESGSVYDYDGHHRAWYENGILRDEDGNVAGFGQNPADSLTPLLPLRSLASLPSIVELEPLRPLPELPPIRPLKRLDWSSKILDEVLG